MEHFEENYKILGKDIKEEWNKKYHVFGKAYLMFLRCQISPKLSADPVHFQWKHKNVFCGTLQAVSKFYMEEKGVKNSQETPEEYK